MRKGFVHAACLLSASWASAAVAQSTLPPKWVSATSSGLACNGSTDDTGALNSLITSLSSGGTILFPAGSTCVFAGTVNINVNGIHLVGGGTSGQSGLPTVFNFTGTGTGNGFNIGTQGSSSQTYNVSIENATVSAPNRTGGYLFSEYGVSQAYLRNIYVESGWLFLYGQNFNNVILENINGYLRATSGWMINLYGHVGVDRSDVLTLDNVVLNNNDAGASGLLSDGTVYTVRGVSVGLLNLHTGIRTQNSQGAGLANVTQAFFFDDLEIDGAGTGCGNGIEFAGGNQFHIVNSDIDVSHAGTSCTSSRPVSMSYDAAAGTEGVYIESTALHDSPMGAIYINAHDVLLTNVMMFDLQHSATIDSAVNIAPSSADVLISNSKLGHWQYTTPRVQYGVNINTGATRVSLSNNNYYNATTGNVLNSSSSVVGLGGGIGYNGAAISAMTCAASSSC